MTFDITLISIIIGSIGGLLGIVSILWNFANRRKEQKQLKWKFLGEVAPLVDIEYKELERSKIDDKDFVLSEIILTNKSKYELKLVGFDVDIANLELEGLPPLSFKNKSDGNSTELTEEFGNLDSLFEAGYIFSFTELSKNIDKLLGYSLIEKIWKEIPKNLSGAKFRAKFEELLHNKFVEFKTQLKNMPEEKIKQILSDPNAIRECHSDPKAPDESFLYFSTMKTGLKNFLLKYLKYTLDVNSPLNIPILFQFKGEGFYKLNFTVAAMPTGVNWKEEAKLLGIGFKQEKVIIEEGESKEFNRLNASFSEDFVRHLRQEK
jgi:hypothetical protein